MYHLDLSIYESYGKEELAALVARHFDSSLNVDEEDSIISFIQRVRNGEKCNGIRLNEKKEKKSSSRKRQREDSITEYPSNYPILAKSLGGIGSGLSSLGGVIAADGAYGEEFAPRGREISDSIPSRASFPHSNKQIEYSGGVLTNLSKKGDKKSGRGVLSAAEEDNDLYCICSRPSYGNMIACDGKKCPNPSQWYHLECVGLGDGRHPNTWFCPECDPKGFTAMMNKKKKSKASRSKSPGAMK